MIYNKIVAWLLRSPLRGLMGNAVMLVQYRGRKSGQPYETPVNFVHVGAGWLVTSQSARTWWRNFQPEAPATLLVQGRAQAVVGRAYTEPAAVAEKLAAYLAQVPGAARYFQVRLGPDGAPLWADVQAAAPGRVMVLFTPAETQTVEKGRS